jgi:precorrin-4 methylase
MAVGRIGEITNNMTNTMGYPIDTPVAIIEKATTIDQRILLGTLKNISSIAIEKEAKAPATRTNKNKIHLINIIVLSDLSLIFFLQRCFKRHGLS